VKETDKMETRQQAIVIGSDEVAFSAVFMSGIWNMVQFPDVCGVSPVFIMTVDSFSGTNLLFLRSGDIVLADCDEVVLELSETKNISPFRVRTTNMGDFMVSPPTDASRWIVTKISPGVKTSLLEAGGWIEGFELYMLRKEMELLGKKGEILLSVEIEMIF
jgi:hypothetical protein